MVARIDKLTPEQTAQLQPWADKWIEIGLSTMPADRATAEAGILECYKYAELAEVPIFWVPSPMAGVLIASLSAHIIDHDIVKKSKGKVASDKYDLPPSVGDIVAAVIGKDRSVAMAAIEASLDAGNVSVHPTYAGQFWVAWAAHISFFIDVCSLELPGDLPGRFEAYRKLVTSAGSCWPNKNFCLVCERPHRLLRNESGQLHCTDGPAIEYGDGWGLWAIDGTEVDEQIVLRPETQTIAQIHSDTNEDRRAIRIERLGWVRYLEESEAKVIDSRRNDVEGTREVLFECADGQKRFVATCRAKKLVALGVPPETKTCKEAQAWLEPFPANTIART